MRRIAAWSSAILLVACAHQRPVPPITARQAHGRFEPVVAYLQSQVDSAFPGAAIAVGRHDSVLLLSAVGHYGIDAPRPVTPETVYDLASLTKVIGLTNRLHDSRRRGEARARCSCPALRARVSGAEQGTGNDPSPADPFVRPSGLASALHRGNDTECGIRDRGHDAVAHTAGGHVRLLGFGSDGAHTSCGDDHRPATRCLPRCPSFPAAPDDEHAFPAAFRLARPDRAHGTEPGRHDHPWHGARRECVEARRRIGTCGVVQHCGRFGSLRRLAFDGMAAGFRSGPSIHAAAGNPAGVVARTGVGHAFGELERRYQARPPARSGTRDSPARRSGSIRTRTSTSSYSQIA